LAKKVETLAKIVAKTRDGWICQHCDKKVSGINAHGSHVIPVSAGNLLRFDPLNIKCLCYHCHRNFWHLNPTESGDWFKNKFPERWLYLKRTSYIMKITPEYLAETTVKLKEQLCLLLNNSQNI
jgi:hypothetical protein